MMCDKTILARMKELAFGVVLVCFAPNRAGSGWD